MIVAGVWTGVGFSNLKNCRTRIEKFWNRSGVGIWKSDSGHLWFKPDLEVLSFVPQNSHSAPHQRNATKFLIYALI